MTRDEVATTWRELVLKHTNTLGGACNFQDAAHELAEIVQTALKAALAEPVQEPVAWMCNNEELVRRGYSRFSRTCSGEWNIPVWTHPPRTKTNQCGETCERARPDAREQFFSL